MRCRTWSPSCAIPSCVRSVRRKFSPLSAACISFTRQQRAPPPPPPFVRPPPCRLTQRRPPEQAEERVTGRAVTFPASAAAPPQAAPPRPRRPLPAGLPAASVHGLLFPRGRPLPVPSSAAPCPCPPAASRKRRRRPWPALLPPLRQQNGPPHVPARLRMQSCSTFMGDISGRAPAARSTSPSPPRRRPAWREPRSAGNGETRAGCRGRASRRRTPAAPLSAVAAGDGRCAKSGVRRFPSSADTQLLPCPARGGVAWKEKRGCRNGASCPPPPPAQEPAAQASVRRRAPSSPPPIVTRRAS